MLPGRPELATGQRNNTQRRPSGHQGDCLACPDQGAPLSGCLLSFSRPMGRSGGGRPRRRSACGRVWQSRAWWKLTRRCCRRPNWSWRCWGPRRSTPSAVGMVRSAEVPNCAGHPIAGCSFENPEKLGLLGSFCGCRLQNASTEKSGAEAVLSGTRTSILGHQRTPGESSCWSSFFFFFELARMVFLFFISYVNYFYYEIHIF